MFKSIVTITVEPAHTIHQVIEDLRHYACEEGIEGFHISGVTATGFDVAFVVDAINFVGAEEKVVNFFERFRKSHPQAATHVVQDSDLLMPA
ncbi:MAG: hypothetical protein SOW59_04580 [Corynebacterium sp.]|nr:hypothetical protein [Corynebacterium sp.]